jgi:glycosyltransferase involved in cell wall biosynthesis
VSSGRRVPWKGFEGIARVVEREKTWHFFLAEGLPRSEALGWVKAADVFVLNSTYEGLSHALVEAMALGTPVIATRVGGNPELIQHEVEGLLIPPQDDEALHWALMLVDQDRVAAHARAESAHAKVKQFSIDASLTSIASLLSAL